MNRAKCRPPVREKRDSASDSVKPCFFVRVCVGLCPNQAVIFPRIVQEIITLVLHLCSGIWGCVVERNSAKGGIARSRVVEDVVRISNRGVLINMTSTFMVLR